MAAPTLAAYEPPKEAFDHRYLLLPTVLQHVAHTNPNRVYGAYPATSRLEDGLYEVTFTEIAKAVDALSTALEVTHGKSTCFQTLAYVGINDFRYSIFLLACVKTGHKALFVSPRNTGEQNAHLLKATSCKTLYHSIEYKAIAIRVTQAYQNELDTRVLKPLQHWITSYVRPYPYTQTFENARYHPVVVLHSSGSTGPPKPIVETHQFFLNYTRKFPCSDGRRMGGFGLFDFEGGGFYFSSFPFCHLGGVLSAVVYVIFSRSASFLTGFPDRPATVDTALKILQMRRTRTLFAPPSIIEGLTQLPQGLETVRKVDNVIFAGGPLSKHCGDLLSQLVVLSTNYGSTETGTVASYVPKPEDWQYFDFHPAWKPTFEKDLDDTYELVVYQDDDADHFRPIGGSIMRSQLVYRTRDLFVRHPYKPHLWRFSDGRKDDIIVFSNGQKWNPVPSECYILSKIKADGVLAAGLGRPMPALLVEMDVPESEMTTRIQQLWPIIEEANSQTQRYGRINKSKIAFVPLGSFVRTPKGTVVRRATLDKFQSKIEELYEATDEANHEGNEVSENGNPQFGKLPSDAMIPLIRRCVHDMTTVAKVSDDEDLFVNGLDSIEAAEIAGALRKILKEYIPASRLSFLRSQVIFDNPTINDLASTLQREFMGNSALRQNRANAEFMISKYSKILVGKCLPSRKSLAKVSSVAITGTTGSLGSNILEKLLEDKSIMQVICLNRNTGAESTFRNRPDSHSTSTRVKFLSVDFCKPALGLSPPDFNALQDVDAIFHCAWEVNFNHSLATYEHQFRVLDDLVEVALSGKHTSRVLFISSVSAVASDSPEIQEQGRIPATLVPEPKGSQRMGYAVSKNVGEHLVAFAHEKYGLPASIIRVGQIAGSSAQESHARPWNRKEWIPSIVDTSAALGIFPRDLPDVDWVPVDTVARVVVELMSHDAGSSESIVYNIVNPHPAAWAPLAAPIVSRIDRPCELVPFAAWLESLEEKNCIETPDLDGLPALKILPYLKRREIDMNLGRQVDTASTSAASTTFANMSPISEIQMIAWMCQWGY